MAFLDGLSCSLASICLNKAGEAGGGSTTASNSNVDASICVAVGEPKGVPSADSSKGSALMLIQMNMLMGFSFHDAGDASSRILCMGMFTMVVAFSLCVSGSSAVTTSLVCGAPMIASMIPSQASSCSSPVKMVFLCPSIVLQTTSSCMRMPTRGGSHSKPISSGQHKWPASSSRTPAILKYDKHQFK